MLAFDPIDRLPSAYDHEMAQLELGIRRIVKREFCSAAELLLAQSKGWHVAPAEGNYGLAADSADLVHGSGQQRTVFIGDEASVERACALELIERQGHGEVRHNAIRELGALLGYPSCCTEAYLAQTEQSENASFQRLFHVGPTVGGLAGNNFFVLSHALISHFPCSMTCSASAKVAHLSWAHLADHDPNNARLLAHLLSLPIVVWDRYRFLIAHPDGEMIMPHQIEGDTRLLGHPLLADFVKERDDNAPPSGGVRFEFEAMW